MTEPTSTTPKHQVVGTSRDVIDPTPEVLGNIMPDPSSASSNDLVAGNTPIVAKPLQRLSWFQTLLTDFKSHPRLVWRMWLWTLTLILGLLPLLQTVGVRILLQQPIWPAVLSSSELLFLAIISCGSAGAELLRIKELATDIKLQTLAGILVSVITCNVVLTTVQQIATLRDLGSDNIHEVIFGKVFFSIVFGFATFNNPI